MIDITEVRRQSAFSEDELITSIGTAALEKQGLAGFPSRRKALETGKMWLQKNSEALQRIICNSDSVRSVYTRDKTTTEEIVLAVATSLAEVAFTSGMPLISISMILVSRRIPDMCNWTN